MHSPKRLIFNYKQKLIGEIETIIVDIDHQKNLVNWYISERQIYQRYEQILKNLIEQGLSHKHFNYHKIESRTKSIESFRQKVQKKNLTKPCEITDIVGIRIIGYVYSDIKKLRN